MATDVMTAASGRWRDILEVLAGLHTEQLSNRHQPCPACGGRDRYRFDDRDGSGSWFCNQCGGKDHLGGGGTGMDLLMRVRRWSFRQACEEVERYLGLELGGSGRHRPQPVSTGNGSGGKIPAPPATPAATGLPGHGSRPWRQPELPPAAAPPPALPSGATAMRRGTSCFGSSGSALAAAAARLFCIACGSMAAGTGPAAAISSPANGRHPGRSMACRA